MAVPLDFYVVRKKKEEVLALSGFLVLGIKAYSLWKNLWWEVCKDNMESTGFLV